MTNESSKTHQFIANEWMGGSADLPIFAILEPKLALPFAASFHTGFTSLPFFALINV